MRVVVLKPLFGNITIYVTLLGVEDNLNRSLLDPIIMDKILYCFNVFFQLMSKKMEMKCRCHGVSGSCAVKTCWNSMPAFKKVGDYLKKR